MTAKKCYVYCKIALQGHVMWAMGMHIALYFNLILVELTSMPNANAA